MLLALLMVAVFYGTLSYPHHSSRHSSLKRVRQSDDCHTQDTFSLPSGLGCPTSLDFLLHKEQQHLAVSYNTAKTIVYDLETSKPVLNLDSATTYGEYTIHS